MHSTAKLSPFAILKKKPSILKKNPIFERFEKSYYFSRILQQICYHSVKKVSRSETATNIVNAIRKHRVKKRSRGVEGFAPIFYNMAQNNIVILPIC